MMPHHTVHLLGIPWDDHSSYMKGPALAPPEIRNAFDCDSANKWTESGIDLGQKGILHDVGDLVLHGNPDPVAQIRTRTSELLERSGPLLCLGGDHAVTYPVVHAVCEKYASLNILHFDAHPDLYDELHNDRLSHACPFARIMETGRVHRLVQVGIRCMTGHQKQQAKKFGVEVHEMKDWQGPPAFSFDGPLYISFDMDALDPAFAPGVSHWEPGGLSLRDVLQVLRQITAESIVSADLVEFNPRRDPSGRTAMVAAKIMKEMMGLMLS
ncbi:MAG: agmatinase [Desulfotignum sp.]|nr:agmatinase [Desulfotignum sp.]